MMLPAVTDARRADRMHAGITFEPRERVNRVAVERFSPDLAPDPVRDSSFVGGRGIPVMPSRQTVAFTRDPYAWAQWEIDRFRGSHYKVFFRANNRGRGVPRGVQGPWALRANIADPARTTYGDAVGTTHGGGGDGYYFPGGR